jgi:hypothetical protein
MNFMIKNGVNPCKPVLSLPNGSVSKSQQPLYKCRAASTNPHFYAKQTQFSPVLAQKQGFRPKTNPIQTQSNPNEPNFSPKNNALQKNKPKTNPNLGNMGNLCVNYCSLLFNKYRNRFLDCARNDNGYSMYSRGSVRPASAKPFRRRRQESHRPQLLPFSSGS